jgi:hypothetical protein
MKHQIEFMNLILSPAEAEKQLATLVDELTSIDNQVITNRARMTVDEYDLWTRKAKLAKSIKQRQIAELKKAIRNYRQRLNAICSTSVNMDVDDPWSIAVTAYQLAREMAKEHLGPHSSYWQQLDAIQAALRSNRYID